MWFLESDEDREVRRLWKSESVEEILELDDKGEILTENDMKGAKREWIFRVQVRIRYDISL